MKVNNEMCLFKVNISRNYKDNLLHLLSKINNVHIKPKSERKSKFQLSKKIKEDRSLLEKIKKLRQNIEDLLKKLQITHYDLQDLKFDKKDRLKFIGKNLQELINKTLVEIDFYINRISELERYIVKATIELENIKLIKSCYLFLNKFNFNRLSLAKFNQLNFKVYTTFTKNLSNMQHLFEFSTFPNIYQTTNISNDRIIFFIIYPKDKEDDLNERINIIHAEEVHILKKYLTYDGINFKRINKEISFIEKTISKYNRELKRIREDNLLKFAALNEVVQNLEEYNWADSQFEELTSTRLILSFFIPIEKKIEVEQNLIKTFEDKIIINTIDIDKRRPNNRPKESQIISKKKVNNHKGQAPEDNIEEEDLRNNAPTIMKNFFLFRPFETLTRMYGTPSYSEIDPTPYLAFTFPLLFGLMFGDIGHGLCLIIAGLIGAIVFRKQKGSDLYNFCWIIFYCGWGTVLFGFLYGEFFGMEEMFGVPLNPINIGNFTLHNPLDNIMTLFMFAIFIGIIHINLGWFIQFLNYWKQARKYFALTDSLIKISLLSGGAILIFIYGINLDAWFASPYPILLPLIPGILLILSKPLGRLIGISYLKEDSYGELMGEGSMEIFETMLSILSNIASYIRLLALALAHIALMISIQAMIGIIQGEGILIEILIVIGLIFGNLMVILLEGILVFINNIRLHFYEFFSKFYQGSGIQFFPFYLDNKYSVITFKNDYEKDIISEAIEKKIGIKNAKENIERAITYISAKYH